MVKLPGFSDVAHKPGQDHMSEQSARAERPKHWFLYLSRVFGTASRVMLQHHFCKGMACQSNWGPILFHIHLAFGKITTQVIRESCCF